MRLFLSLSLVLLSTAAAATDAGRWEVHSEGRYTVAPKPSAAYVEQMVQAGLSAQEVNAMLTQLVNEPVRVCLTPDWVGSHALLSSEVFFGEGCEFRDLKTSGTVTSGSAHCVREEAGGITSDLRFSLSREGAKAFKVSVQGKMRGGPFANQPETSTTYTAKWLAAACNNSSRN